MKTKSIILSMIFSTLLSSTSYAKDIQIVYIPLDNRPVCLKYVKETIEPVGIKLIMPPEKLIANNQNNGNPTSLLNWLKEKSLHADAAVISTDSLIYGGLVASRTHNENIQTLHTRVDALAELARETNMKIYAFSTIMRTPRASRGNVEPHYYPDVGPSIFAYSEFLDKKILSSISITELLTMQAIERNMKKDDLGDWLSRRKKNFEINKSLIRLSKMNRFHYLAIGKDDNSPHSATHLESCKLGMEIFDLSKKKVSIIDGVDQLGLLLMARAYNEANGLTPSVKVLYAPGAGSKTLPQYSDATLYDSVPVQIAAAGGTINDKTTELILAINSPVDGIVKDSTATDNLPFPNIANRNFISQLQQLINQNQNVSLADISYSNGSDNGFMETLVKNIDIGKFAAYNGWNTADNAIGYAIAQGMLASHMNEAYRQKLIRERLIDDWFYQSNIRSSISKELSKRGREELKYDLGTLEKTILPKTADQTKAMAKRYPFTKQTNLSIDFPWNRLFEIDVTINDKIKKKKNT